MNEQSVSTCGVEGLVEDKITEVAAGVFGVNAFDIRGAGRPRMRHNTAINE